MKVGELLRVIDPAEAVEITEPNGVLAYRGKVDSLPWKTGSLFADRDIDNVATSAYTDESVFIAIYLTAKED